MADIDQDLDELGKRAREAAEALREISGVRRDDISSTEKNSASKKVNTKATNDANKALALLEKTIGRNVSSMYRGEKAGKQFSIAIEQAADVLSLLIALAGPFGKLGKAIGIAAVQLAKLFGKESVEQAQKLYDTYQQIGTVGGGLGTSLEDLAETARQAGFGIEQLEQFSAIIRQNAKGLAMFGGSVAQGTKQFTAMVEPLVFGRLGENLQNMGLSIDEIRESTARYTKLQARLGLSQSMSTDQLTKSSYGYLENLNLLSRLTGASVEEQQAAQDRLLSQQRFRAAQEEALMSGDAEAIARMNKARDMFTYYTSIGAEDLAQGVADAATGFVGTSEASMQIYRSVPEIQKILSDSNLNAIESIRQVSGSAADTQRRFLTAAKAGADISAIFGNTAQALDADVLARQLTEENLRKVINQQAVDQEGSIAQFTKATIGLQYTAAQELQRLIGEGIVPATDAMAAYADFVNGLTGKRSFDTTSASQARQDAESNLDKMAKTEGVSGIGLVNPYAGSEELKEAKKEVLRAKNEERIVNEARSLYASALNRATRDIQSQKNIDAYGYFDRMNYNDVPMTKADLAQAREDALAQFNRDVEIQTKNRGKQFADVVSANKDDIGYATGGIVSGPLDGYTTTLHGTEAVVPLPDGKEIPVDMKSSQDNTKNTELLEAQVTRLDEMIRIMGRHLNVSEQTRSQLM